jgi:hypothetical protein
MHSFDAKGGATFNFNPDLSGEVGITTRSGREVWVDGADLIEFMRHVESLSRKGDTLYNGNSEFMIVKHDSSLTPERGISGDVTCELPHGETLDPALPTTIGKMPIRFTDLKESVGPAAMTRFVHFEYVSAWPEKAKV